MSIHFDKSIWLKPTIVSLETNLTFVDDCTNGKVVAPSADARCTTASS